MKRVAYGVAMILIGAFTIFEGVWQIKCYR